MTRCEPVETIPGVVRMALIGLLVWVASAASAAGTDTAESSATARETGGKPAPKKDDAAKPAKPSPPARAPKEKHRDAESSPSRSITLEPVRREEPDVGVGGVSHESEKRPDATR
jgi:hypothetical protein